MRDLSGQTVEVDFVELYGKKCLDLLAGRKEVQLLTENRVFLTEILFCLNKGVPGGWRSRLGPSGLSGLGPCSGSIPGPVPGPGYGGPGSDRLACLTGRRAGTALIVFSAVRSGR